MTGNRRLLFRPALALLTAALLLLPALAQAQSGLGVSPASVEVEDALRGSEYLRTVIISNLHNADLTLEHVAEGEVGKWISLRDFKAPEVPLEKIVAPPEAETRYILRMEVPKDAPNGRHTGSLRLQTVVTDPKISGAGVGVSVGLAIELSAQVTGTQKLAGSVVTMATNDVEVDQPPLRIETKFQNTGNVRAKPVIQLKVKDSQGGQVGEASYSDVTVEPNDVQVIRTEWDITGKSAGKYVADVAVLLADAQVDQRELQFEILPRGTLTRSGELQEISLEGQPQVGAVTKIVGRFQNTGKIDTKAILLAEVYRDSKLVKVVESRERVVSVGDYASLELFLELPESGSYSLRGKVNYEGKETQVKELAFRVAGVGENLGNDAGQELFTWSALAAALFALMAGIGWALRRRLVATAIVPGDEDRLGRR